MSARTFVVALAAIACITTTQSALAQSGTELFQQALEKERAEGKLGEAIALYQRIVKENSNNRQLVARTLVQMGAAYERLGGTEARKAYERVVREYGDQTSSVADARRRIAVLDGPPLLAQQGASRDPGSRRLWVHDNQWNLAAGLSRDGKTLVYADFNPEGANGNLIMRDIATGTSRQITRKADVLASVLPVPAPVAVSPDSRTVAYAWIVRPNYYELRVVTVGGEERTLVPAEGTTRSYIRVHDFTPDGKQVLVDIGPDGKDFNAYLVSIADGRRTRVIEGELWHARISPDGKFIAYDRAQDTTRNGDIFVRRIDGTGETAVIRHPSSDTYPVWTPDGRGIVFMSTRSGTSSAWFVPVQDGRATGSPQLALANAGSRPLGFAANGSLLFVAGTLKTEVYVGEIDPATGAWTKQPSPLETLSAGTNTSPAWSPDSRHIVYLANRAKALRIHDLETGTEREFELPFPGHRPTWSPDGKSILVVSLPHPKGGVVHRLDPATGLTERIVNAPTAGWGTSAAYSRDGSAIFYSTGDPDADLALARTRVVRHDLSTGAEQTIYTSEAGWFIPELSVSPDGSQLVFGEVAARTSRFTVVASDGRGMPRFLGPGNIRGGTSWTPDGKFVLYPDRVTSRDTLAIVSVAADGSSPARALRAKLKTVWEARLAPDGRHVALRVDDESAELWLAEHFLPTGAQQGRK